MPSEKLVRDKIPEIIRRKGISPIIRKASDKEIEFLLSKKLIEEALEYHASGDITELADILEVIHALLKLKDVSWSELEQLRQVKLSARGGFDTRTVLFMSEDNI